MALLSIWATNPEAVLQLSIEQIVTTAGTGKLLDGSECSAELRTFLSQTESLKLIEYSNYCLTSPFNKSGLVLQDIVNELGRRLGFNVTNGRYQGVVNKAGNDGLWESPEGHHILVEVKTSDAYRISLNTIDGYRNKLREENTIGNSNSMLLIVGREDTGELEAQIRGSRHAWDMRLISVDSLTHLIKLKESTETETTSSKIRSVLIPLEYTRLDTLIDVMFSTAKDVEDTVESETPQVITDETRETAGNDFTEKRLIKEKRNQIIEAFESNYKVRLISRSRAQFWSADHKVRLVCSVSKRYSQPGQLPYWYAYHPKWKTFLDDAETGFMVLGCMDSTIAFSIPAEVLAGRLAELNKTVRSEENFYWHLKIIESAPGKFLLQMPETSNHLSLNEYKIDIAD